MRQRREKFLVRGLSMYYIDLCFEAYDLGIVSAGRLAEMLLAEDNEVFAIAELYGKRLKHED